MGLLHQGTSSLLHHLMIIVPSPLPFVLTCLIYISSYRIILYVQRNTVLHKCINCLDKSHWGLRVRLHVRSHVRSRIRSRITSYVRSRKGENTSNLRCGHVVPVLGPIHSGQQLEPPSQVLCCSHLNKESNQWLDTFLDRFYSANHSTLTTFNIYSGCLK